MLKKPINTTEAPAAIGPYSQAIRIGDFLYTSGQISLDPKTMEMVTGNIEFETENEPLEKDQMDSKTTATEDHIFLPSKRRHMSLQYYIELKKVNSGEPR